MIFLLLSPLLLVALLAVVVDRFGRAERARGAPVIIVLGAKVKQGGVASDCLRARTLKGIALYQEGKAPLLLFSGGVGQHPPAEALVARELALAAGVPDSACLVETQSDSTRTNALYSARLLAERGIREAILVSDPFHLLRARQYFHREGMRVQPSPAPLEGRSWVYWTVREALALLAHPKLLLGG